MTDKQDPPDGIHRIDFRAVGIHDDGSLKWKVSKFFKRPRHDPRGDPDDRFSHVDQPLGIPEEKEPAFDIYTALAWAEEVGYIVRRWPTYPGHEWGTAIGDGARCFFQEIWPIRARNGSHGIIALRDQLVAAGYSGLVNLDLAYDY